MNADFDLESEFMRSLFSSKEEADKVIPYKVDIIGEYESIFSRYDKDTFREYFTRRTGVKISSEFIDEWLRFGSCLNDKVIEGVFETLEYLKMKDKKLVILSNWFTITQIERLRKNNLLQYFDEVYGGDYTIKPHKEAFLRAFPYAQTQRFHTVRRLIQNNTRPTVRRIFPKHRRRVLRF